MVIEFMEFEFIFFILNYIKCMIFCFIRKGMVEEFFLMEISCKDFEEYKCFFEKKMKRKK